MAKGIFQKIANWIHGLKTPEWLMYLLVNIVRPILEEVGEYVIEEIKNGVILANGHTDWSNEQKFNYVFDRTRDIYKDIGENALGIAIKVALAELKKSGVIPE